MEVSRNPDPVQILLVEDSPSDIRLTREALKEDKLLVNLNVVTDGAAGLEFLRGEGEYAGTPRPDVVILDLNLPKMSGKEVLAEIKQDPDLKSIPVVVLTTSEAEQDIKEVYELNANCYISKPLDLENFHQVVRTIEHFWLTIVRLPEED